MYEIKFTVKYNNISFENFAISDIAYLDFSGSGILILDNFDNILNKGNFTSKEDFVDLLMEDYFRDLDMYENTIHLNQYDVDSVYKEYVKQYRKEWD